MEGSPAKGNKKEKTKQQNKNENENETERKKQTLGKIIHVGPSIYNHIQNYQNVCVLVFYVATTTNNWKLMNEKLMLVPMQDQTDTRLLSLLKVSIKYGSCYIGFRTTNRITNKNIN